MLPILNNVLDLLREQKEAVLGDVERCELMIDALREDAEVCRALTAVQARLEATADEIDKQIEKLDLE